MTAACSITRSLMNFSDVAEYMGYSLEQRMLLLLACSPKAICPVPPTVAMPMVLSMFAQAASN